MCVAVAGLGDNLMAHCWACVYHNIHVALQWSQVTVSCVCNIRDTTACFLNTLIAILIVSACNSKPTNRKEGAARFIVIIFVRQDFDPLFFFSYY